MDSQKPSGFADPVLAPTGPGRSNTGLHQAFYVAHSRLSSIWWIDTLVLWNSRFGMLKPLKPYKGLLERSGTCLWDEQRQQSCWSLRIWTALTSVFPLSQTFTDLQWFLMSLPTSSLSSQILVELCWLGFGAQTFPPAYIQKIAVLSMCSALVLPCLVWRGAMGGQYDCNLKHSVPRVMDFCPRWTIASMLSTWLSWSYALLSMECWCWRATGSSDIEHIRIHSCNFSFCNKKDLRCHARCGKQTEGEVWHILGDSLMLSLGFWSRKFDESRVSNECVCKFCNELQWM
jgi:hypothetical protein